jgi:hypothetical protein
MDPKEEGHEFLRLNVDIRDRSQETKFDSMFR